MSQDLTIPSSSHQNITHSLNSIQEEEEEEDENGAAAKDPIHNQLKIIDQDSEATFGRLSELEKDKKTSFLSEILERTKKTLKSDKNVKIIDSKIPKPTTPILSKIPKPSSGEKERKTPLLTKLYNLSKSKVSSATNKPTFNDLKEFFEDLEPGEVEQDPEALAAVAKFMKEYKVLIIFLNLGS